MATIHIDGKSYEVDGSDNLLAACLSLGIDVPYFCYHPALGSVGSCRQCAVKQYMSEEDYKAGRGRLVMSCMVAPTNDMYISVDDDEARDFRKRIVEYIMTNHPHDCPTCEEGGHCHLQDMTYMSGHRTRRYRFVKRTHHNQDLGEFINHEMNRCIACYRCVRFYKDYAGGSDFGVYASNNRVYFGRETDGQLQSEFSGNLTEVCPTGVFTDKTHSDRYNRKWDMQYAPSICHGCSVGCSISAGERYGELRRIENRYNPDVNGYFICDRGRFGYGYVNRADRPVRAYENLPTGKKDWDASGALDEILRTIKDKKVIGIGSAMASLESNFALQELVGADNFAVESNHHADLVAKAVNVLRSESVHNVSLAQIENADAVLVLGEDITQTAARVALSVRQAAKNKAKQMATALRTEHWLAEPVKRIGQENYSPIYVVDVVDTKLTDIAKTAAVASIEDIARLGFLVGETIAQMGADLTRPHFDGDDEMGELAYAIAKDLLAADKPLIVSGTSLGSKAVLEAVGFISQELAKKRANHAALEKVRIDEHNANLAEDAKPLAYNDEYALCAGVYLALPAANSVGVHLLGAKSLETVLASEFDVAFVLEQDLANLPVYLQDKLYQKTLIALDHQHYAWHDKARFVLPVGSFAESDGTLVSAEGRAGRYFAAYDKKYYEPSSELKDAWRWLYAILGNGSTDVHFDDVVADLAQAHPELQGILAVSPEADYRVAGLKIARSPRRSSGRTSMRAKISIHEPMQPKDLDTPLTFSMEGYVGDKVNSANIPFAWSAGWNSPQAWNKLQDKVGGRLKGGEVGVRLFDDLPKLQTQYASQRTQIQDPVNTSIFGHTIRLVPVHRLFGADALSSRAPVVQPRIDTVSWLVAPEYLEKWQIKEGDLLTVSGAFGEFVLPVAAYEPLPDGCVGYLAGQVPLVPSLPYVVKKVTDAAVYRPAHVVSMDGLTTKANPLFSPQVYSPKTLNTNETSPKQPVERV